MKKLFQEWQSNVVTFKAIDFDIPSDMRESLSPAPFTAVATSLESAAEATSSGHSYSKAY